MGWTSMRARTSRPRILAASSAASAASWKPSTWVAKITIFLRPCSARVQAPVRPEGLVEALRPEDRLRGLAAEVARDGAAVDRRPERRVVLLPVLHHVVAVGPVLVGDAHQDLGLVLLEADLGRLALLVVADVLGDQLPGAAERRVEVDDLLDREAHVVGERRPVRRERAGVVGELADRHRSRRGRLGGGRLGAAGACVAAVRRRRAPWWRCRRCCTRRRAGRAPRSRPRCGPT